MLYLGMPWLGRDGEARGVDSTRPIESPEMNTLMLCGTMPEVEARHLRLASQSRVLVVSRLPHWVVTLHAIIESAVKSNFNRDGCDEEIDNTPWIVHLVMVVTIASLFAASF